MADNCKEPCHEESLSLQFIREGYLYVSVKEEIFHCGTNQRRILMGKGLLDTSVLSSWNRRWAVLSQLLGDTQILLYKDHHSFDKCEAPYDVIALHSCLRLASLPTHHKSDNTFMVLLEKKTVYFYTDKCSEKEGWMKILQSILQMADSSCYSPLKGLPRQKALRKGSASSTSIEESTGENPLTPTSPEERHREHGLLHKASKFLLWGSYHHSLPDLTTPPSSHTQLPTVDASKTPPTNDSVKFISKKTLNT